MGIYKKLKRIFTDFVYKRRMKHLYRGEVKKFKNQKRKAIYSTVVLKKEQKSAIDTLFKNNYGKKVSYVWHRHFTAFTGNFDENYLPETLFIPEFELFMNYDESYIKVFSDKNVVPYLAKSAGVKTPEILLYSVKGTIFRGGEIISFDSACELLKDNGETFVKPTVGTSSGVGCVKANFKDGKDLTGGLKVEEILRRLGKEFAVQKVVKCCDSLKKLHPESVNTFRVMTYIWKGEIVVAPAILRLGMGKAYLDNAHQGGVFIAVDSDGTLHKTAFTEFNRKFDVHPDSGIKFEGYKISQFPSVVAAAKKLHALIPQLGVINWDFTVDQSDEPVLIEANTQSGSIWLFQMAHGKGVFGDRTSEVLRWMRAVKKVPHSKWGDYAFGNIPEEK